jgi:TatD DNase family protein
MFTDSHAHLTSDALKDQVEPILKRAHDAHVDVIVNICTDESSLDLGIMWQKSTPGFFNAAATTPHDVVQQGAQFFPIVKEKTKAHQLVAIGETGLDYYYEHSPKQIQQEYLIRYLQLALDTKLPVIFHCREAFDDLFSIYDEQKTFIPSVLHCFTGTITEAKQVLDHGWYLSFSGIITFKKSEILREVVKLVPLDRLLIETDSPYLAPQSRRGKVNEPAFIIETAQMIADLKQLSLEEIARITSRNAREFFSFK